MGKLVYRGEQGRHLSDDMGQRLGWNEGSNYVTRPLLIGCLVVRCTLLLLSHTSSYGHWIIYTSWLSIPTRFQNPGWKCLYLFHVSLNSLNWSRSSHDLVPPGCFLVRSVNQLVIRSALKRAKGMMAQWVTKSGSVVTVLTEPTWWPELDFAEHMQRQEERTDFTMLSSGFHIHFLPPSPPAHHIHQKPILKISKENEHHLEDPIRRKQLWCESMNLGREEEWFLSVDFNMPLNSNRSVYI